MCSTRRRCRRAISMPNRVMALFNAARRLTASVAAMTVISQPPRLFLLTRNAQPVGEGDRANPAHAVLWGLGRTLALEHPEIWGGIIDVDESVPVGLAARYVVDEAHGGDGEDQVIYRAGMRRVPRLQRGYPPSTSPVELDKDRSHLVIGATGNIGPHLIRQLADMGAAHHRCGVTQSGFAPRRVGYQPVGERNDVGHGGRRCVG